MDLERTDPIDCCPSGSDAKRLVANLAPLEDRGRKLMPPGGIGQVREHPLGGMIEPGLDLDTSPHTARDPNAPRESDCGYAATVSILTGDV
jgi:hypothetical protein